LFFERAFPVLVVGLLAGAPPALAQVAPAASPPSSVMFAPPEQPNAFIRFFTNAEWYVSWGTSKQWWSNSDIHVSQPALGNNFTLAGVRGVDDGFGGSQILKGDLFGPQYNVRIGRFVNDARTIGVEFSLDHSKYNTVIGQVAPVSGVINGVPVSGNAVLTQQYFSEVLHNGANHVMLNAVYRMPLFGQLNDTWSSQALVKVGAGVMLPHTTDTILGMTNDVGSKTLSNAVGIHHGWWQLNGWTTGAEAALRFVLYKPVFLEVSDKVTYAQLIGLPAAQGRINQSLWMNEAVVSLGVTLDESLLSGHH
jgi:hypothetical protein